MQINLGQTMRKRCSVCQMQYTPSDASDAATHAAFHAKYTTGIDVGREFALKTRAAAKMAMGEDVIARVVGGTTPAHHAAMRRARLVLDFASVELGAVEIDDTRLWGDVVPRPLAAGAGTEAAGTTPPQAAAPRFECFLYLRGTRCVGLCLTERITQAHRLLPTPYSNASDDAVQLDDEALPASIGISRIWTLAACRREGIAARLLDRVVASAGVEKEAVAFSQPTASGRRLASRWFGREDGWSVYRE